MTDDTPDVITVEADGPIRIVRLNRPDELNAVNHALHRALLALFTELATDTEVRAVVLTGNGKAFSAGGDFQYLGELVNDPALRAATLADGRRLLYALAHCPVPIVAAVNGPAVGLGASLVALSDIVFISETAHLADPHVAVGLVAADGGPITWPLHTSLHLAKEFALTGAPIPARRAAEIGLANHVCAPDELMDRAMACAARIAKLPQGAVVDTKRILNMHIERTVQASVDFAFSAESRSFDSPELQQILSRHLDRD